MRYHLIHPSDPSTFSDPTFDTLIQAGMANLVFWILTCFQCPFPCRTYSGQNIGLLYIIVFTYCKGCIFFRAESERLRQYYNLSFFSGRMQDNVNFAIIVYSSFILYYPVLHADCALLLFKNLLLMVVSVSVSVSVSVFGCGGGSGVVCVWLKSILVVLHS